MDNKNLYDDNYFNFYLLSNKYIVDSYQKIHFLTLLFKKISRFLIKLLFHSFFTLFNVDSYQNIKNKIVFYAISKNNYDSLNPVYKKLKNHSIFLKSDYRLSNSAFLFPIIIPLIISIYFIPSLIHKILYERSIHRKRYLLYLDDILLSMGFRAFAMTYLKFLKPKAIIYANDHSFYSRILIKHAEKLNIPCFYIQHSAVTEIFPSIISSYALLEGKDSLNKYSKNTRSNKNLFLIGSPKFDNYIKHINTNNKVRSIGICSTSSMDKIQVIKLVKKIKKLIKNNIIFFRPHPAEMINKKYSDNDLLESIQFSNPLAENSFDFLRNVDVVITGHSSILLEATMMNVYPILWLDTKSISRYNDNHTDKYGFVKNKLTESFYSVDEIIELLVNLLSKKPDVRDRAEFYIENINQDWDGKSAHYAASIIQKNI